MNEQIERAIQSAIFRHPELTAACRSVSIELHPDVLVLDGQVESIAAKRRLALLASHSGGGLGVFDRVRVETTAAREDGEIRTALVDALGQEPIFRACRVLPLPEDEAAPSDATVAGDGRVIGVAVSGGTVRLSGTVDSLGHRRLAEVLSWWIPGTTDVDNHLQVLSPQEDSDEGIADAVRMALEKNPRLDAASVKVHAHAREIHLTGVLPNAQQRHLAECDAWYVRGVHAVVNDIALES